ncbi:sensor domain-containing phosphodiesterase [Halomonas sp. YLGW01]|uniref:bifunctional diguanylate cyclase/phosphodiesterase n=1 Tax=Halomonas sp. YLGW01 TaxID=2773308 RepID=UPI00177E70D6|nr:sensor domain-containing phosphodiesterase [Halomonas sp. YLGW01]
MSYPVAGASQTIDEQSRLKELQALKLLGTEAEQRFDRLTKLVADVLEVPICLLSLLDDQNAWIKSAVGVPAGAHLPRDAFLCHKTLYSGTDVLMVTDTIKEPALAENALVTGDASIRFYAGIALRGPGGLPVGTLCVMDTESRELDPAQRRRLQAFAELAEHEMVVTKRLGEARDDLVDQAFFDPASGLPRRLVSHDHLQTLIDRAREQQRVGALAVIHFLQFDEFLNTYGREALTRVVRLFAERLQRLAGEGGLVARPDKDRMLISRGDFAMATEAWQWAQRVYDEVVAPYPVGEGQRSAAVAIGVSDFPDAAASAEELMRQANLAKELERGQGLHRYDQSLGRQVQRRDRMTRALIKAIEDDELSLHFQPILDVGADSIVSCEALARWQCEEFGRVSPGEFIPLTEESPRLCRSFTRWVLEKACCAAMDWNRGRARPVAVNINVAGSEFYRPGFLEDVEQALVASGLSQALLVIEVTEQTLIQHIERAVDTLAQLRGRGILCALDDFGTGYSSLSYLRQLPLDILKIDRSFLDNLEEDHTAQEVTRGIADIGQSLKMAVIAEGIETPAQQTVLRGLGIEQMQGFLWHRPMSLEALQGVFHGLDVAGRGSPLVSG